MIKTLCMFAQLYMHFSVDSAYLFIFWQSIPNLESTKSQLFGIEYISIQQDWSNFPLEQLEQKFPCRNHMKLIKESVEHSPLVPTV